MGRPELPLDRGAGPVAAFATDLRQLRRAAGSPSYRELSRRASVSASVLSGAASGARLPTLRVTLAFVKACGGEAAAWERRWRETVRAVRMVTDIASVSGPGSAAGNRRVPGPSVLRPYQVPPGFRQFAGRYRELARLDAVAGAGTADAVPPLLVTGPLGAGKSALVAQWTRQNQSRFPDGVLYSNLSSDGVAPSQHEVVGDFLYALGVPSGEMPAGTVQRAALFRSLLAERRMLVLLDNATEETQVRPLLVESPGSQTVITSRARLAGLDGVERIRIGALPAEQSLAVFSEIVGGDEVLADLSSAAEIAELCDHLPLALRVIAVRMAVRPGWSLAHAATQLRDESHRLDYLKAGDLDIRETLGAACDRLNAAARRAFIGLGRMPGAHLTAWQVADRLNTTVPPAEDLLEMVVDAGLLQTTSTAGRYRLPPLFRLYANEVAAASVARSTRLAGAPHAAHPSSPRRAFRA